MSTNEAGRLERELGEAEAAAAELAKQIALLERKRTSWEDIARGKRGLIEVLRGLPDESDRALATLSSSSAHVDSPSATGPAPRGEAAILEVIREMGPLRPAQVRAEIAKRGWVNPNTKDPGSAVSTGMHRAVLKRRLRRDENGLYHLPAKAGP